MDEKKSNGYWFFMLLALLFIAMKLMHYINWSWIWVLIPLWGPYAIGIFIGVISGIVKSLKDSKKHNDERHWMDEHENEELLRRMWTGETEDDNEY